MSSANEWVPAAGGIYWMQKIGDITAEKGWDRGAKRTFAGQR